MNSKEIAIEVADTRSYASSVADEVVILIQDAIDERGLCCIALAGGSTPGTMYRLLGRPPIAEDIDWSKVHLFWGDERWVSHSDDQSNYKMTRETFIGNIDIPEANIHMVKTDLSSAQASALDYEKDLERTLSKDPEGNPRFDLVLLGVGEDGHTASLFPGSAALTTEVKHLALAVTRPDGATRITLTPRVLRNAVNVIFMVTGENKSDIVGKIINEGGDINDLPALIYREMQGKVSWFLDTAAARKLNR